MLDLKKAERRRKGGGRRRRYIVGSNAIVNVIAAGGEKIAFAFTQLAGRPGKHFVLASADLNASVKHSAVDPFNHLSWSIGSLKRNPQEPVRSECPHHLCRMWHSGIMHLGANSGRGKGTRLDVSRKGPANVMLSAFTQHVREMMFFESGCQVVATAQTDVHTDMHP